MNEQKWINEHECTEMNEQTWMNGNEFLEKMNGNDWTEMNS